VATTSISEKIRRQDHARQSARAATAASTSERRREHAVRSSKMAVEIPPGRIRRRRRSRGGLRLRSTVLASSATPPRMTRSSQGRGWRS
jgi:hypothetical protein